MVSQVDEQFNPVPGTEKEYPCDTLILSVGLIPENELTWMAGAREDAKTKGAAVDERFQTTVPGIFAAAAFEGCISLVYVAAVTFVLNRTLCRRLTGEKLVRIKQAGLLTLTTVLFLYVIFKQFFSVNLAAGILNF